MTTLIHKKFSWILILTILISDKGISQTQSIALVQCELDLLRVVRKNDSKGSGLMALSKAGQQVIEDLLNVAAVVDANGNWWYRHEGNNYKLFNEKGIPSDQSCVEAALRSSSFTWICGNDPCSMRPQNLHALLAQPDQRNQVAEFLKATEDREMPSWIKSYVRVEVGTAIAHSSESTRLAMLADKENGKMFSVALTQAKQFDQNCIKKFDEIGPDGTTNMAVFVASVLRAASSIISGAPKEQLSWQRIAAENKIVYSVPVGSDLVVYAKLPADRFALTNKIFVSRDLNKLLLSGDVTACAARPSTKEAWRLILAKEPAGIN